MTPIELAHVIAAAAFDKKASKLVVLDMRGLSDLCEVQVICSAENERQSAAIAEGVEEKCRAVAGVKPSAIEGKQSGNWVLMDYGSVLVHIFVSAYRDYYSLESLWPTAKNIAT